MIKIRDFVKFVSKKDIGKANCPNCGREFTEKDYEYARRINSMPILTYCRVCRALNYLRII